MTDLKEKSEKLIKQMKADRGYIYPQWEFVARADPDFMEAYNNLYRSGLSDGQALAAKYREFVAIGILSFRGSAAGVKSHMERAIRLGATRQEILDVVETTIIPGGASTFSLGLKTMMEVFKETDG